MGKEGPSSNSDLVHKPVWWNEVIKLGREVLEMKMRKVFMDAPKVRASKKIGPIS